MTRTELQTILDRITYLNWDFALQDKGDGFLVQARFHGKDSVTGLSALQTCRKWYVSSHSTEVEVVRTVWKAVLSAIEHEAGEEFKYDGVAIYNPHVNMLPRQNDVVLLDERPDNRLGLMRGDVTVVMGPSWYWDDAGKMWASRD